MLPFELLYRDISKTGVSNEDLLFAKSDVRNVAYDSFRFYNKKDHKVDNITKSEHKAFLELKTLVRNDTIIIQKADKGNVIVLLDKITYLEKMENILSDNTKFLEVKLGKRNKELDYLLEEEDKITKFLITLRDKG